MAMYKFHLSDTGFHLSDTNLVLISGFKSGYFSNIEVAMATQQAFRWGRDEGAEVSPHALQLSVPCRNAVTKEVNQHGALCQ